MHSFTRHQHESGDASGRKTRGLVLDQGWYYDLTGWFSDTFMFGGAIRKLRHRTIDLAGIQRGEQVLDVGCGTGTLAITAGQRVGATGRVFGIDPAPRQIARARAKAAWRRLPIAFQVGVIEQLPFADQTLDVVLSTLMMHHLPAGVKRQGLAEIARVLKPGGRLVIADFAHRKERQGRAAHFHAGGSNIQELTALVEAAGFERLEMDALQIPQASAFPGAGFLTAYRR